MSEDIRLIHQRDYSFLRKMLYEAIFVPRGEKPLPETIIDLPEIAKYIDNWGRKGDFGLIIYDNNKPFGAIWCRLFSDDHKGYGYVDSNTPELSMAIKENYRNRGFGTKLMNRIVFLARENGFKALSLSVDKRNRAASFYIRTGFEIVNEAGTAYTMKKVL
jgi:[ribosomal protein S18]-alanine N-acetyltransferase